MVAFVYGGQVHQGDHGAFPVRGSTLVLVCEGGQVVTDKKALVASDLKTYGDLVSATEKRKGLLSAGIVQREQKLT